MARQYDEVARSYARYRRPEPRIATAILSTLGDLDPIINVGAGTGNYEPLDRRVVAVEPSRAMIDERTNRALAIVQASATALPFRDKCFAAATALLTMHHWPDRTRGLHELARVTRHRIVVLTHDIRQTRFWLIDDYFPHIRDIDHRIMPRLQELDLRMGTLRIVPLLIPHDCTDGFLGAYWRRPAAYLDPDVRSAISTFAKIPNVDAGLERLRRDVENGTWHRRNRDLLDREALDLGYRLATIDLE